MTTRVFSLAILSIATLLALLTVVNCPNEAPVDNSQRIQPYAKNPHYCQYKSEPVLLVGGTIGDNLFQLPFLKKHLDTLASVAMLLT